MCVDFIKLKSFIFFVVYVDRNKLILIKLNYTYNFSFIIFLLEVVGMVLVMVDTYLVDTHVGKVIMLRLLLPLPWHHRACLSTSRVSSAKRKSEYISITRTKRCHTKAQLERLQIFTNNMRNKKICGSTFNKDESEHQTSHDDNIWFVYVEQRRLIHRMNVFANTKSVGRRT